MNNNIPSNRYSTAVFWLILFLMLAKFNLYLGFALKPYMIFCILFFALHFGSFYFHRLHVFEMAMLLFYLMYSFTGAFSLYPVSSARILVGILIYISCYFVMKNIIGRTGKDDVLNALSNVGILFNGASLIFYFAGLKSLNFIFETEERISALGVMVDRNYPRLIGLMQDPNFFVFYNTIFFAYYLCHFESRKNKIGLILVIFTNLLTFSRGGLLVIFLLVVVNVLLNKPVRKLKLVMGMSASLSIVGYIAMRLMKFDIYSILQSRVEDFSEDGGSGRLVLWERAWEYFNSNILVGIGAFNFSDYNFFENGDPLTAHNTYLDILAESGLLGFISYGLFLTLVFIKLLQRRIHKTSPYLFLAFLGMVLQMGFLSVIINDMFFLYIAILSVYLHQSDREQQEKANIPIKGRKVRPIKGAAYHEHLTINR